MQGQLKFCWDFISLILSERQQMVDILSTPEPYMQKLESALDRPQGPSHRVPVDRQDVF